MTEIMVQSAAERASELNFHQGSENASPMRFRLVEPADITRTRYQRGGKRLLDLAFSSLVLLLASPLLLAVWTVLRLALGPKILMSQQRVGQNGQVFGLYKFRTMKHDRRETHSATPTDALPASKFQGLDRRRCHKSSTDPRHVAVGQLVRKYSLDELPQLLNILKGQMSVVGPRPELLSAATESFVAHPRHRVRPGLTGPYQTSNLRTEGNLSQGLRLDKQYSERVTIRQDLRYILATVAALLRGTGS